MPVNRARLVLSQSCSVLRSVVNRRLSIIVLMLSFSSATSPRASTWIDRVRSPLVTAVATSAIARTWLVRFAASRLTLPVRSFHVPAAPGTLAWPPSRPSTPTSRATDVTWSAKIASVFVMLLMVSASAATSPFDCTVRFCARSPFGHRGHHLHDAAHLVGEVGRHHVDGVGQVLPGAAHARHLRLAAQLAFGADLARDARHLGGEGVQLVDHRVDGVLELEDLAVDVDGDLAREVAARDRRGHLGDVAHLRGQVGGQQVHVVGQVLPGAGHARHLGLAAELALGADLARHAGHLGGERAQLLHHRVDRVLELRISPRTSTVILLREVAARDRRRDLGDVAHLRGQVAGHEVDVVGEVLPGAGHARHLRLAAELALGADLARDARHLGGEGVQLVHHRVDGVLELQDLALHVDRDLAREVAARDRRRHLRDVAHLRRQVAGHRVDVVGEVLPRARHARHLRLAAELALGADLARHARHLGGEAR